jgi:hypothetical protein
MSYSYKTTGKIILLYVLIFKFLKRIFIFCCLGHSKETVRDPHNCSYPPGLEAVSSIQNPRSLLGIIPTEKPQLKKKIYLLTIISKVKCTMK